MWEMYQGSVLAVLSLSWLIPNLHCADPTDISRLRQQILANYDVYSRPVQAHQNTTQVNVYFMHNGFEFDEGTSTFTLHALVFLSWTDEHVKWEPLMFGNLTEITFNPTELWRPDITLYNSYDTSQFDPLGNTLIFATNEWIWWAEPATLRVPCVVDYYKWPYDVQTCKLHVASWAYTGDEINLVINDNHTQMEENLEYSKGPTQDKEWEIVSNSVRRYAYTYDCCPDTFFPEVEITVNLQRRSPMHTAVVVVVAIGIASGILISFWLNPFAKERVPVILIALTLNATFLNYVYAVIPNNGGRVPWMVAYFRDSLVMVTVALAWTFLLRRIAKIDGPKIPVPLWAENFLVHGWVGTLCCLNPRQADKSSSDHNPGQAMHNTTGHGDDEDDVDQLVGGEGNNQGYPDGDWGWFANVMDRIAFFMYLITYTCFILSF